MTLVGVSEVAAYKGLESPEDATLLQALINQVEATFLRQVGRSDRPFQPADTGRVEVLEGTGTGLLFLGYPIAALTTDITLGYASPWDETISPADTTKVIWGAGGRRITRVDGGCWGPRGAPRFVRVTYDAAADEPEDVRLAIMRVVAALWLESGTAEATSERILPDGEELQRVADQDRFWQLAVEAHWEAVV